jgi:hypothetical protein
VLAPEIPQFELHLFILVKKRICPLAKKPNLEISKKVMLVVPVLSIS